MISLQMEILYFIQDISGRGMLKIEFSDSKREIVESARAVFLGVCKDICLKRGVVVKRLEDFSKAGTEKKYDCSISRNHAKNKFMDLWLY